MLNINNQEDVLEMMKYHRTKDMMNLKIFFPELSPIQNLVIVQSLEDYRNNYEFCKNLPGERNDTLITNPCMKSIEIGEVSPEIIESQMKKVKEIDRDGVLVLFDFCHEPSTRYERYAGISVGVTLGTGVYIDAVGRGFDGREVTKGIARHERYSIPWYELRHCCMENFKEYRTDLISEAQYKISRQERIAFLTNPKPKGLGIPLEVALKNVPEKYTDIPDFIWLDVIRNLVKKLEKMEDILETSGFHEFSISGHTEGRKFYPWQMPDDSRYNFKRKVKVK